MSRRPTRYPINDIRSRFQTVALDNKYQVFMEPNLNVFNAAARAGISRRFVDEDLGLYVSDAVLPGSSFADVEVSGDRQGITERMPFKRIYDDVTLTFMVDKDYKVLKYFEAWMQLINPLHGDIDGKAHNQVMTLNYPKDYKCTMSIVKFNKDYFRRGGAYVYYCFVRSWPLSISSVPVNYDSGSVLKLNVTFRYERYVMENVTRGMIRSGWKGYSDSFDPWLGAFPQVDKRLNPEDYKQKDNFPTDKTVVDSSVQNDDGGIYDGENTIKYPNGWEKKVRSDGSNIPFWPWNWTQEDADLLFGD
tara:strand:+ start:31 stop:942 length:912 start_codon:yes stop_codon:yes gene_type:complete